MTQTSTPGTINAAALLKLLEIHPIPGSVYAVNSPTLTTLTNCALDHYGTDADGMMELLDPAGPRTNDEFCLAWWGKPFAQCYNEILLTERFVQWIRQSSDHEDPANSGSFYLNYLGGDCLDTCIVTQTGQDQNRRFWVGSDYYINGTNAVDLAINEFLTGTLPNRNHLTNEFKNTEVDKWGATRSADALGAGFRTMSGPNLTPAFTPNQTTYPSTLYWNLAVSPSVSVSRVLYVGAWLTTFPGGGGALDHQVEDSHILHINGFGTVSETATFDVGPGGKFYICDIVEDTSFDYVYGREFVPQFGDFSPNYFDDELTVTSFTTVARTPHGSLMATGHTGGTFTTYQFWSGTSWTSSIANLARLEDTNGNDIAGDCGIAKLGTSNYVLVAQDYFELEKRCYRSTTPEGPWSHYYTIPAPPFGIDYFGVGDHRGQLHTKVHPDFPSPDGHVMTMAAPLSAATPGRHILDGGTPYFLAVPEPGLDVKPPLINAAATVHSPIQVQLVIQYVQPPVIAVPSLTQEPQHLISLIFGMPSISTAVTMQAPVVGINLAAISPATINVATTVYSTSVFNVITVTRSVSQGNDDGYEEPGFAPVLTDTDLYWNKVGIYIGLRFQDIQVPQGATIVTAALSLVISEGAKNDAEGLFYAEDVDNAVTFGGTDGNIDTRTTTGVSVSWTANDLGITGATAVSPNIGPVIQEVLDRAGWASGNSLVILYVHNSDIDKLQIAAFEHATHAAPLLTIHYLSSALIVSPGSISATASVKTPGIGAIIDPGTITVVTSMHAPSVTLFEQLVQTNKIDAGSFLYAPIVVNSVIAVGVPVSFRDPLAATTVSDPVNVASLNDPTIRVGFGDDHDIVFQEG